VISKGINGLVLAGGKSLRMGTDKGTMLWHGVEQRYYVADMLKEFCDEVFISCRAEQEAEIKNYHTIPDSYTELGPYGAILSAFKAHPNTTWLVVACDLPLLDTETLQLLISNRDANKMATTFESPYDGLPEPLITIWEPKSYEILLSYLPEGYKCPRKALRNNLDDVKIIKVLNPDALMNTNTPEDAEKVKQLLAHAG
jgi:molybdopterin-guanine dinucleotide biosynthesis protein A